MKTSTVAAVIKQLRSTHAMPKGGKVVGRGADSIGYHFPNITDDSYREMLATVKSKIDDSYIWTTISKSKRNLVVALRVPLFAETIDVSLVWLAMPSGIPRSVALTIAVSFLEDDHRWKKELDSQATLVKLREIVPKMAAGKRKPV